jgi:hypothetical protein
MLARAKSPRGLQWHSFPKVPENISDHGKTTSNQTSGASWRGRALHHFKIAASCLQ